MMTRILLNLLALPVLLVAALPALGQGHTVDYYRGIAPFEMPEIALPAFADTVFLVTDYGAVGDGQTDNTLALTDAIADCAKAGGGRVTIPAGIWLTGPLLLQSHVNLHIERGAMLVFSADFNDYPMMKLQASHADLSTRPLLFGSNLTNVAITGGGIIDGSGTKWWPVAQDKTPPARWQELVEAGGVVSADGKTWWPSQNALSGEVFLADLKSKKSKLTENDYLKVRVYLRPHMIHLINCTNVQIDGLTLQNAPKAVFYSEGSSHITLRGVTFFNEAWTDSNHGVALNACENVALLHCRISVGGAAVSLQAANINKKKKNDTLPQLHNVLIAECSGYGGHSGCFIGEDTDGGIGRVFIKNCDFTDTDVALRLRTTTGRGGRVKNIYIEDVRMHHIRHDAVFMNTFTETIVPPWGANEKATTKKKTPDKMPEVSHFYFKNIYCTGAGQAFFFRGLPEQPLHDIYVEEAALSAVRGITMDDADRVYFKKVQLNTDEEIPYVLDEATGLFLRN